MAWIDEMNRTRETTLAQVAQSNAAERALGLAPTTAIDLGANSASRRYVLTGIDNRSSKEATKSHRCKSIMSENGH
jgi:hypothetical protein